MSSSRNLEFIYYPPGTEVFFAECNDFSSQTWVLAKKLKETSKQRYQEEVKGYGPSFTAVKFLCYRKDDITKKGIMRIYLQAPIIGTEFQSLEVRAKQAALPGEHRELSALKTMKKLGCFSVPELQCFQQGIQDQNGLIPGGYMIYLVWERVPGESLDSERFWAMAPAMRRAIRDKFRIAYEEVTRCGWEPLNGGIEKIIFDEPSGELHITGFRVTLCAESEPWSESSYVLFGLAEITGCPRDWWNYPEQWTL